MRKFSTALRAVIGVLVALVALVFAVIEGTLLMTLDFNLYENEALALIQLTLRLVVALAAFTLGLLALLNRRRAFLPECIALSVAAAVMTPFITNGIGIYVTALSVLFMLSDLFFYKAHSTK